MPFKLRYLLIPLIFVAVFIYREELINFSENVNNTEEEAFVPPQPPYILKDGCIFTLVHETGSVSADSMVLAYAGPLNKITNTITYGKYKIVLGECRVLSSSPELEIYDKW